MTPANLPPDAPNVLGSRSICSYGLVPDDRRKFLLELRDVRRRALQNRGEFIGRLDCARHERSNECGGYPHCGQNSTQTGEPTDASGPAGDKAPVF